MTLPQRNKLYKKLRKRDKKKYDKINDDKVKKEMLMILFTSDF